jgi:MerR family mercuric resistance operon transcriptional regulator
MARMTIGELARRAGVGIQTVRFYQRRGLIEEPPKRARGFREYPLETLHTLRFIRRAKGLGFSLKEVSRLLRLRRGGSAMRAELMKVLQAKQADLERKIAELEVARRALSRIHVELEKDPDLDPWPLLDPDEAEPWSAE